MALPQLTRAQDGCATRQGALWSPQRAILVVDPLARARIFSRGVAPSPTCQNAHGPNLGVRLRLLWKQVGCTEKVDAWIMAKRDIMDAVERRI